MNPNEREKMMPDAENKEATEPTVPGDLFQPSRSRLLVQRIKPEEQMKSGLYKPEKALDPSKVLDAKVFAVGRQVTADTGLNIGIGDKITFSRFAGHPVTIDGEEYLVIASDEVIGFWPSGIAKIYPSSMLLMEQLRDQLDE